MAKEIKYKLLIDKPLRFLEEDKRKPQFGHEEIAKTIANIVSNCPNPFTLGLFGRWGSGKSTIAYLLRFNLKNQNIPVIIFDVWKHEGDALRRTFLKEVVKQLKGNYGNEFFYCDFVLNEKLESSITKNTDGVFKINYKKINQLKWLLLRLGIPLFIVLVIVGYFAYSQGFSNIFLQGITTLVSVITGGGFLIWLIQNATQFLSTETTTYGKDRFADPHEFESEFAKILNNLKYNKVVIVFDNLDRVTHNKSVEVLSTIKTFLEPEDIKCKGKDVIFLIPCDANAIKQHIKDVYKAINTNTDSPFNPEEFLKKFFNSVLWIPDFIPGELETYARNRLKETNINLLDNDKIAWLITKGLRDNPRQIVQFINVIITNYLLIKEREGEGKDFPSEFLQSNTPQLVKYLLLNELFLEEMEALRKNKVMNLEDITAIDLTLPKNSEFIKFIKETERDIPINNLRIFYTLRRSENEKKLPGIDPFLFALEDRKQEEAQKYFEQLKIINKQDRIKALSQVIKTELGNKTNPISIAAFIDTLLFVLAKYKIFLEPTTYMEINSRITELGIENICNLDPKTIHSQLLKPFPQYKNNVLNKWIRILKDQTEEKSSIKFDDIYINDLFKVIGANADYLDEILLKELRGLLTNEIYSQNVELMKILANNKELKEKVITPNLIISYIKGIKVNDNPEDILDKFSLLIRFELGYFDVDLSNEVVKKINEIQATENKNTSSEYFDNKMKLINLYIVLFKTYPKIIEDAEKNGLDSFIDNLLSAINATKDFKQKKSYIILLLLISEHYKPTKTSDIHRLVKAFITTAKIQEVKYVIENTVDEKKFIENSDYTSTIDQKAVNDQDFFDYIYKKVSVEKKSKLLEKLFDNNYKQTLKVIENLNYRIPNSKVIIDKALKKIKDVPNADKAQVLEIVNKMKCSNDQGLREKLVEILFSYITSSDLALQEIGHNGFLGSSSHIGMTRKRSLVKDVFDWIRKPEISNKYQPYAIKSIFLGYLELNNEEQGEFQQFVFEELIRKGTKKEMVELGFELLEKIKPKYEDRKSNFDDIKERIKREKDETLKHIMLNKLKNFRPTRQTNKQTEDYWEEIDKMQKEK